MNIKDVHLSFPPPMRNMIIHGSSVGGGYTPPVYDASGRVVPPITQMDAVGVTDNIAKLSMHQQVQQSQVEQLRNIIDEKFNELERRQQDAMALMYYTIKYYPHVMSEFQAAQKTKERIGVEPV